MEALLLNLELAWKVATILAGFGSLLVALIAFRYLILLIARVVNRGESQRRPEVSPGYRELLDQQRDRRLDSRWLVSVGDERQISAFSAEQELFVTFGEDGKPSGYVRGA
jgi:hypothetical protein